MKKLISLLFFTIIIFSFLSAQNEKNATIAQNIRPQGTKLCDELFKDLKKAGFSPKTQNLTENGQNDFPYNITIKNKAYENSINADNLFFVIKTEEAYDNLELVHSFAAYLKKTKFPFNTTILISYGEDSFMPPKFNIYGTDSFIKTLNTDTYNIALVLNLSAGQNNFETGAMGKSVPAWLIKYVYGIFKKTGLTKELPHFYLSQLSKIHDRNDRILSTFLQNDIPAITVSLSGEITEKQAFLEYFTQDFADSCQYEWDSHTIMFSIFGKSFWMNEFSIVITLIFVIFSSLAFLFILSLINSSIRSQAWKELKKIWYAFPAIFIVSSGLFFLIKIIFYILQTKHNFSFEPYTLIYAQIAITSPFIIALCLLEIKLHDKYSARALDFMTLFVVFLNQFLFCLVDISFFPLFMIICIITVLSIIFRNNIVHIILLLIMTLPLLPYTYILLHSSQNGMLASSIINSNILPFLEAFYVMPFYLQGCRIIKASKLNKLLSAGITYTALLLILFLVSISIFNIKTENKQKVPVFNSINDNLIKLKYSDKSFFGETIRTVNIDLVEQAEYCTVEVSGWGNQAVLYSENGYEIEDADTIFFRIPKNPPVKMNFSYGTIKDISTISVTAFYKTENPDIFTERNFTITIEDTL